MSNGIYSGPSQGATEVIDGYIDYSMEVIARRSFPDVRDGLKPVSRRILYAVYNKKVDYLKKCSTLVGQVMELHPHGDSSIYGNMALMTDENGSFNMPLMKGMGNLGKKFSSAKPAAMRYPKAMIHENAFDFFKDSAVMDLVPAEEGDGVEPSVLPVNYPVVLVNGTTGIGVGVGTKTPSFNFGDVIDLTVKYIQNGKLEVTDTIIPDFPTGGVLVCNDTEIAKIMTTGKGKIKVRAKVEIEGKKILVKEVPVGKRVEGIKKSIDDAEIKEVVKASITADRNSTALLTITCRSKNVVEMVLMKLYRMGILQNTFSSNMLVIEDGEPKLLGVHGVIECWYNWRLTVVEKKFKKILEELRSEIKVLDYFIRLVSNEEWKDEYVRRATKVGKKEAGDYLHEIFDDIPNDVVNWIAERSISAFNRGGSYANKLSRLQKEEEETLHTLAHLDEYIINELLELKESKKGNYERKTEVSYTDYKFSRISDSSEIEDTSYCIYTLMENGFLKKTREDVYEDGVLCRIEAQANSILIGFDNFGRVLRIPGKEIPFTGIGDEGLYLPRYFDASFQEDYRVLYLGLLDGKQRMLVYRDGYIGFFDTSMYYGKKVMKVVSRGMCVAVYDKLLHIYEEDEIPERIVLADDTDDKVRIGIVAIEDIPVRSNTSRAKVLESNSKYINTCYLKGFNPFKLVGYITNADNYMGKLKVFRDEFLGDPSELADGRYLGICKDYEQSEESEE